MADAVSYWNGSIAKAINPRRVLPEKLRLAVENKDHYDLELDGPIMLMDLLITASSFLAPARRRRPWRRRINNGQ